MDVVTAVKRLGAAVRRAPLVEGMLRRRYDARFVGSRAWCRGVFPSFAAAIASAPAARRIGCDQPEYAAHAPTPLDGVNPRDYPALFWMSRLLREGATTILDLGGHVGVKYHAYRRYLEYPPALDWLVCDLPEMVREGERLARERGAPGLRFTTEFREASGRALLYAQGSLQYIERPFAEMLRALPEPPRHLLLNGLPLQRGPAVVTLQSLGKGAFAAYHVFNDAAFTGALEALGYRVVDRWANPEKSCVIPFHPEHSVAAYSGLYLARPA